MRRALAFLFCACVTGAAQEIKGQIEKFTTGHEFVSALAWSSRDVYLLVADGPAGIIKRIDPKGTTKWRDGLHVNGLAVDEKNVYVADARERAVVRVDAKGKVEVLASSFEGKRFNGPADVVVAKNDHIWFTDPAFAAADAQKELPFYGIFHLSPKAEITAIARLTSRPNGLALSPDGKTLYASIADDRTVLAWTIGRNGETTNQRVFAKDIDGVPDGLATSPDGKVWLCARDIEVFSPDGAKVTTIAVPEKPTDCEFGDTAQTLYIAAGTSVYRWTSKEGASHQQP